MTRFWTEGSPETPISGRLLWRMTLPVAAVGVLLLGAGIYGAWRVHRLHKRGTDIIRENVSSIRVAEELETVVRELRYRLKRYLSTGAERHLDIIVESLPEGRRWVEEADTLGKTDREQQLIEQMAQGYRRFEDEFGRLRDQESVAIRKQIATNLADEVLPNKVLVYTQRYIGLNEREVDRSNRRNQSTANRLMFGLILLGTCGGVAGLLAGYGIARRVSRTIVQLTFPLRDVAGKLNDAVGPVAVAADPGFKDLESVLQLLSHRVSTVVERLQEREREMLRAEQLAAVGQLAAGLAHELRNPLTSLKTVVQLADGPDDLSERDLQILEEEIARLEQSLQAFLDFARPSQPEKREIDLRELLEQPVALVSRRARRQQVEFRYDPPPQGVRIVADVVQVRQVVLNLILNALEAVPHGGTVTLEAAVQAETGTAVDSGENGTRTPGRQDGWLMIRVHDTGSGMPEQLGERIFEPFVSTKETGTGLGLSICKRIVEAHDGEITAENSPEGGAVFTVRLPLRQNAGPACRQAGGSGKSPPGEEGALPPAETATSRS